jgi:hypothetical protein
MNAADQIVKKWLDAPLPEDGTEGGCVEDQFDPWEDLGLLGCYSSEFDDLAIAVLADMRDNDFREGRLAGEMFRELLCVKGLCEYGTSPRCCWPFGAFRDALPAIIQKWEALRAIRCG